MTDELSETSAPPPGVVITSPHILARGIKITKPNITLRNLSRIRVLTGLHRRDIEKITTAAGRPITEERLKRLENGPTRYEPWYWEARDLSRLLLLDGILPLMSELYGEGVNELPPGHLLDFDLGTPLPNDYELFTQNVALPLSHACRIAASMSLEDPIHIDRIGLDVELWSVLERNERGARAGECPWCLGRDGVHLDTCIPNRRWSPHTSPAYITSMGPQPARPRDKSASRIAVNLRAKRKEKHLTMPQLGAAVGIHPNYLSRIERGEVSLTDHKAGLLAQYLGCRISELY